MPCKNIGNISVDVIVEILNLALHKLILNFEVPADYFAPSLTNATQGT